ncbi:MAG TPA: NHL repeat-containing protein [Acidobacteriaceae bacterium]|nr:NHL repeat-containing protein [Acidobacteriaceae bacterium]
MLSGSTPVVGASISFYAAGSSGPGAGAANLVPSQTIATDTSGKFSVPAFTCPSSTAQVYLVGRGGNGSGTLGDNSAISMMAALGDCANVTSSTAVLMNEVTTAASVWALEQFIGSDVNVGASSTNATGLRNAFFTVGNLVDNSKGATPGPSLPANALLEIAKVNTLADILWSCNQSTTATACQNLFAAAADGSTTPSDTLDAALNIVRNPAAQVSAVFGLLAATPFQPALPAAPHDWTLSATFGNCASGCGGLNLPGSLAIDSKGDVWVANYFGGVASAFSNTGMPASPDGYPAAGLQESFGIAIDARNSVWITNENGFSAQGTASGSVTHLSSAGEDLSGAGYTGGGIYYPISVATTSGGNIWVADHANSTATLLAADGTAISGTTGYATSALPFTTAVAVDSGQNGWFAYEGGVAKVTPAGAVSAFSCCDVPAGIALDAIGNVWIADYDASSVIQLSSSGGVLGQAVMTGGVETPVGIAIDGAGHVWTANYRANTLSEFNSANLQPLSPAPGFGQDASLYGPFGVAIDASGNLWTTNAYGNNLTEFIGVAAPVKTPLLGPPAQP